MDNPEIYVRGNYLQRHAVQEALQEFAIDWRCDGGDSVLDAGCGPGDVTVDILMPYLPANFSRLIGVDISNKMIDYARKTYVRPNLSFEKFDLTKDLEKQPFRNVKPFDHIFSFYVIMWISNLETYFQNFHKLLAPNGDLFLLSPGKYPAYDVLKAQSLDKRWAQYMRNFDDKSSPFSSTKYLTEDSCVLLRKYGFTDCEVKTHRKDVTLRNVGSLRGAVNYKGFAFVFVSSMKLPSIFFFSPICSW